MKNKKQIKIAGSERESFVDLSTNMEAANAMRRFYLFYKFASSSKWQVYFFIIGH